jgi:VIT1/CCC1 family predicted Fe2+/Mn2+ transporter
VIDDAEVPEDKRSRWEKELNEKYEDCGCHQAGIGFILGAILYILWIAIGPVRLIDLSYAHLWYGLMTAVIGLAIGKISGFYLARKRFQQTSINIRQNWINTSRRHSSQI